MHKHLLRNAQVASLGIMRNVQALYTEVYTSSFFVTAIKYNELCHCMPIIKSLINYCSAFIPCVVVHPHSVHIR